METGGFRALVEDDTLTLDGKADESAVLEDGLTEAPSLETTTSTSPASDDESINPGTSTTRAGTSTRPRTTTTSATQARTATTRRTTTVTSEAPTVTASPTSTTTSPATKAVTTTSAAPAVVTPDEPGPLSPSARLEDVGTVAVSGEDFVVVTPGDSVPTDVQQGVAALEIWLGGGDPGAAWATFASDDPDADGWRWAAVNPETGTVVYIR